MKSVLITGVTGLLGSNLVHQWHSDFRLTGISLNKADSNNFEHYQLNLVDFEKVREILKQNNYDILIHCAALANVSYCEEHPDKAHKMHVEATTCLAEEFGGKFVYISTDMLFDGKRGNYSEDAAVDPLNIYGLTKLEGERVVQSLKDDSLIIRTNFFGWNLLRPRVSSAEWIYDSLHASKPCRLFTDYIFTPIYVGHLVDSIRLLLEKDLNGTYNVVGSEPLSKYQFGKEMAIELGFDERLIQPFQIADMGFKEERPSNISLDSQKMQKHLSKSYSVKDSLQRFKKDYRYRA